MIARRCLKGLPVGCAACCGLNIPREAQHIRAGSQHYKDWFAASICNDSYTIGSDSVPSIQATGFGPSAYVRNRLALHRESPHDEAVVKRPLY